MWRIFYLIRKWQGKRIARKTIKQIYSKDNIFKWR